MYNISMETFRKRRSIWIFFMDGTSVHASHSNHLHCPSWPSTVRRHAQSDSSSVDTVTSWFSKEDLPRMHAIGCGGCTLTSHIVATERFNVKSAHRWFRSRTFKSMPRTTSTSDRTKQHLNYALTKTVSDPKERLQMCWDFVSCALDPTGFRRRIPRTRSLFSGWQESIMRS